MFLVTQVHCASSLLLMIFTIVDESQDLQPEFLMQISVVYENPDQHIIPWLGAPRSINQPARGNRGIIPFRLYSNPVWSISLLFM